MSIGEMSNDLLGYLPWRAATLLPSGKPLVDTVCEEEYTDTPLLSGFLAVTLAEEEVTLEAHTPPIVAGPSSYGRAAR